MYFVSNIDVATEFSWRFKCFIIFTLRLRQNALSTRMRCSHALHSMQNRKKTPKNCFHFRAAIAIKPNQCFFSVSSGAKQKQQNFMVLLLLTEPVTNIDIYLANVVFFHRAQHTIESGRPPSAHIKFTWRLAGRAGRLQEAEKSSCRLSLALATLLLLLSLPLLLFCIRLHIMSMRSSDNMRSPLSLHAVYCSLLVRHIDCNLQQMKHSHQPAMTTTTTATKTS